MAYLLLLLLSNIENFENLAFLGKIWTAKFSKILKTLFLAPMVKDLRNSKLSKIYRIQIIFFFILDSWREVDEQGFAKCLFNQKEKFHSKNFFAKFPMKNSFSLFSSHERFFSSMISLFWMGSLKSEKKKLTEKTEKQTFRVKKMWKGVKNKIPSFLNISENKPIFYMKLLSPFCTNLHPSSKGFSLFKWLVWMTYFPGFIFETYCIVIKKILISQLSLE